MKKSIMAITVSLVLSYTLVSQQAVAQSAEERFQDIFITAGYATAFGAAIGAAALGLQQDPEENLNYIAVGASLGFIGGSIMGAYMVFTPVMAESTTPTQGLLAENLEEGKIYVRPYLSSKSQKIQAIEGAMTLLTF